MKLRQRKKSEKVLPVKLKQEKRELDPTVSWLIKNNKEFKDCFKQLWRLSLKAEEYVSVGAWQEPYRKEAGMLINRMNKIVEQYKKSN